LFLLIIANSIVTVGVQLVSVTGDSSVIDIWSITAAVSSRTSRTPADRLTSSVCDVIVTSDDKLAFVSAVDSDEVGVFDMTSGQLVDLMTHEGHVATFSITSNGAYMFVALRHARLGQFNKVTYVLLIDCVLAGVKCFFCQSACNVTQPKPNRHVMRNEIERVKSGSKSGHLTLDRHM